MSNPDHFKVSQESENMKREKELKKLFNEIDADRSGSIDRDEFMGYLIQIEADIDLMSSKFDEYSSMEEINFAQFMQFMDHY